MRSTRRLFTALALVASLGAALPALAAGYERGPAPTAAALNVAGPYEVASFKISATDAKAQGYGGATVYYPKAQGETFGVVALMPGFQAFQLVYEGLVKKIASHGFIVANLDSLARGDFPDARATQLAAGLKHVVSLAQQGQAPYASVADTSRRAVIGNSMGGGAVLSAASADASLKAVVALQPWHTTKSFSGVKSPTLIVACEKDTIAPNATHSDPFYASLPATLPRAEIEVKGASHLCATFLASKAQLNTMNKSTVSWLKRFLDDDMRYDPLVKGGIQQGEFSRFIVEGF
jgi:alpha-beta hydrolase superfamily lysophospholipase